MMQRIAPLRIVLVTSVVAKHDAISDSFIDLLTGLRANPAFNVTGLVWSTEIASPGLRCVSDVASLLLDPDFCAADCIVYEFGIYYEAFNALLIGNGRALQIVRFHNVTPPHLVEMRHRHFVLRAFEQLHNIGCADEVWADSPENARVAVEYGAPPERVIEMNLSVRVKAVGRLRDKPRGSFGILYVGRFVRAKGVLELIAACRALPAAGAPHFELQLAGNEAYSDPSYLAEVREAVREASVDLSIRIAGSVDSMTLGRFFSRAHILAIPSYHEGFGKTVIEGLAAGCVPIGYASGALPHSSAGLGRLVSPGDVDALTTALRQALSAIHLGAPLPLDRGETSISAFEAMGAAHSASFAPDAVTRSIGDRLTALLALGEASMVRPSPALFPELACSALFGHQRSNLPLLDVFSPANNALDNGT